MNTFLLVSMLAASVCLSLGTSINVEPAEANIPMGENVVFTCTTSVLKGTPEDSVKWQFKKDGEDTEVVLGNTDSQQYDIQSDTTSSGGVVSILNLKNVNMEDSGVYVCQETVAMNMFAATLWVYTQPEVNINNPKDGGNDTSYSVGSGKSIQMKYGANITLECSSNIQNVTWKRNGKSISMRGPIDLDGDEDIDVDIRGNNTLIVVNPELSDAGIYECIAEQQVGDKTFTVKESIEITAALKMHLKPSVSLEEGETARIECSVSGYPPPVITWARGLKSLINGTTDGRIWITQTSEPGSNVLVSTLIIKKVVHDDRDLYLCNATNPTKLVSQECLLRVKDRLAALWPFIGILVEVIVLIVVILICERRQKMKQMRQYDDDEVSDSETKKMNDNTNNKEADIRLRSINA